MTEDGGGGGRSETVWRFPASGFAAAAAVAVVPGSPWGPSGWPARGAFGAFTWASWYMTTGLAATLLLLAAATAARRRPGVAGRALSAGLAFGLLALSASFAASRAAAIERDPAPALAVAVVALWAFRALAARVAASGRAEAEPDLAD